MNNKILISIVGPTAIGKTLLSIKLAKAFNTEILSADSRQFYWEMQIGTAAPSPEELKAAPHHFIHHLSIADNYSVGDFEKDALAKTEELFQQKDILILVGGSGLYVKSLLEGLDEFPEVDPTIRKQLNEELAEAGLKPLQDQLKMLDPQYFERIDSDNPHRVIRALEVSIGTGKPFSSYLEKKKPLRNFKVIHIGLTAPREVIYERINQRVDLMMDQGLPEEAKRLYPLRHLNALNTVGYKELFAFLDGKMELEEAVEEIKKNTRRFAKRQITWYRKQNGIRWFDYNTPANEIVDYIEKEISSTKSSS